MVDRIWKVHCRDDAGGSGGSPSVTADSDKLRALYELARNLFHGYEFDSFERKWWHVGFVCNLLFIQLKTRRSRL